MSTLPTLCIARKSIILEWNRISTAVIKVLFIEPFDYKLQTKDNCVKITIEDILPIFKSIYIRF